jgi:hypothetical protein
MEQFKQPTGDRSPATTDEIMTGDESMQDPTTNPYLQPPPREAREFYPPGSKQNPLSPPKIFSSQAGLQAIIHHIGGGW